MATISKTIRYDLTAGDHLSGPMSRAAAAMDAASRNARQLDRALAAQRKAADVSAGASLALARADKILEEAEHGLRDGALQAEFALKRQAAAEKEAGRQAEIAAAKQQKLADSISRITGGPSLRGAGLALTPALIPLSAGVAAGIGAIGVSFGAAAVGAGLFAAVATSVLSKAQDNLKKLQTLELKVNTATTAAAKKAAQQQVAALKATFAPGYLDMLDALDKFKSKWTTVSQQLAVPALAAWIHVLTDAIGFLKPALTPVADLFTSWGRTIDRYFTSRAGSAELNRIATAFGRFSADQLSSLGVFFTDIGKGTANLVRLLGLNSGTLGQFSVYLDQWGHSFLAWSQSAAARRDVNKFLAYIHENGPVVKDLLKNLGGALAAFSPGLTSLGALELRLITDFLGFLSKLPPSIAKPLIDVAGAALLLSKMGGGKVISFLVTGKLGGIFGKGGGVAGAAGTAAEGAGAASLWSKLTPGARLIGGALAMTLVVDAVLKGTRSGPGGKNWFDNPFGMPGPKDKASANNWLTSWSPYIRTFRTNFSGMTSFVSGSWTKFVDLFTGASGRAQQSLKYAGQAADNLRTRNLQPLLGETGRVTGGIQGLAGIMQNTLLSSLRAAGQRSDEFRTRNLIPLRGEVGKVSGGIQGLQGYIDRLHGKNVSVGAHLSGSGGVQVTPSTGAPGAKNYAVYFKPLATGGRLPGFGGGDRIPILAEAGEAVVDKHRTRRYAPVLKAMGVPGFAAGGLVGNLAADAGHDVAAEARGSLAAIVAAIRKRLAALNPFAGITGVPSGGKISGSAAAAQAFARSILWAYGWGQNQFPPLQALWMGESGWRWNALNPSSGAYGIPQSLPASKMASAGADWRTNPATQIRWGLGYIKSVYGSPAATYAKWLARSPHWYDDGGLITEPILGTGLRSGRSYGFGGRGIETVTPGAGGNTYNITVDVDPAIAAASPALGRQIAEHVTAYIRSGGRLYPAGTKPR